MTARIYQPAKTAMQSGRAKTHRWVLDFEPESVRGIEPLMGWTSSADMNGQVRMYFDSREDAEAFAKKHEIPYTIVEPAIRKPKSHSYSDNFKYNRVGSWTH